MQVAGGCNLGTPEFLHYLRGLATIENALLIFDEIMTSRLDYSGLQVPLGIKPDIATISKWAGGGMSFGAYGATRNHRVFHPSTGKLGHSGTFNNIVTMAAGFVLGYGSLFAIQFDGS
ncbi:glutamate-1-semialdehyde 2,1-aminomutase [Exophiala aquamarina CBS 119918]|uniref:Glutamate-1-semialdehyde 2,1-aminomutase n=1 Tax=Exophiala aquamarina CBS 119918 TaxID=1182545 RepID=A0A072NTE7_9EURO|nr:glutamate-1-semialdehyde 2,1-aminomutase [Exophiala aquamarina CBS 119918]KEF50911.1 glutamate-1-semialdehyde 2,1-aminomutase [Exophiala aquamarina CBS 119918]